MDSAYHSYFCSILLLATTLCNSTSVESIIKKSSDNKHAIELKFTLDKNDYIYNEYIRLSVDNPEVTLTNWKTDIEPIAHYDAEFKDTKKIYNQDFKLVANASCTSETIPDDTYLRVNYYTHKTGNFCETIIPLAMNQGKRSTPSLNNNTVKNSPLKGSVQAQQSASMQRRIQSQKKSYKEYITNLVKSSNRPSIKLLLVFLLGLLFSLTPCIYPMIPITVGVLQAQASKSMLNNFLSAFFYTVGLSTTFAILGLFAAFAGKQIGNLMTNPWVILIIVALLIYVALSLFGFYELYIPRFLQSKGTSHSGSLVSAFIFGMISGTVASPCISPGLILVLTLVSQLQNYALGFLLLFAFGFGLSLPLLIIGTFSTTLNFLPKAGGWMVEIKYVLGFLMIGMCFYFLNCILPWHITLLLMASSIFGAGFFYLYKGYKSSPGITRIIRIIVGMILIATSVYVALKGTQEYLLKNKTDKEVVR